MIIHPNEVSDEVQLREEQLRDLSQLDVNNQLKLWMDGHFIFVENRFEIDQQ